LNFSGMTGNPDHFLNFGLGAIPGGAAGKAWTGDYVFNSGNLKLDLLHNFFLESGARMGKIRVYESTQNPVAREMVGYLSCAAACTRRPTPRHSPTSPVLT
jgi:Mn-containing catalase